MKLLTYKYGYVYKTTNNINNKIYIGKCVSRRYKPTYKGSGKYLRLDIEKYGRQNFTVEIIKWCNSESELRSTEKYYILLYKLKFPDLLYNCRVTGSGGFKSFSKEIKDKMKNSLRVKNSGEGNPRYGVSLSPWTKQKIRDSSIGKHKGELNGRYNLPVSEGTKKKISEGVKKSLKYRKSSKGTKLYTDGIIFIYRVPGTEPEGFRLKTREDRFKYRK